MSLSDVFKALSDPSRRKILRMLAASDMPAGEIAAAFTMSKPSVSHHLSMLKQAGLVEDRRQGQQIIYSLNTTVFNEVMAWVIDLVQRGQNENKARAGAPMATGKSSEHAVEGKGTDDERQQ